MDDNRILEIENDNLRQVLSITLAWIRHDKDKPIPILPQSELESMIERVLFDGSEDGIAA